MAASGKYDLQQVLVCSDFFVEGNLTRGPVLGRGMTGEVVLATTTSNPSVQIAVKVFSLLIPDGGIRNRRLFNTEVKALHGLSHPHVIRHLISARCDEHLAISTVYCPNGNLTSKLQTITQDVSIKYFVQLACAVRYLNDKKAIVHNDIKPDNIFMDANNDPILGDFGLSVVGFPRGMSMISSIGTGGTFGFRAPEKSCHRLMNPYKIDPYSLGVVLWCMELKTLPISDKVHECLDIALLMSIIAQPVRRCLERTLHSDPEVRASAATLLKELHRDGVYSSLIDSLSPATMPKLPKGEPESRQPPEERSEEDSDTPVENWSADKSNERNKTYEEKADAMDAG